MQLINIEFILKTNTGREPKNNPNVVMPNATPGYFFSYETINPKVTAIVRLNIIIPINEIVITLLPKSRNGNDPIVLNNAVFLIPIESISIPPIALPIPIEQYNKIV